jgi:hypothetical protein
MAFAFATNAAMSADADGCASASVLDVGMVGSRDIEARDLCDLHVASGHDPVNGVSASSIAV